MSPSERRASPQTSAASEAPGEFDLRGYLAVERRRVEAALERALERLEPDFRGEPFEAARHGVLGGGKRLRPILCVTAYRACGGEVGPACYDLAASLELIHAYSLMHDDLPCMDDAELRRGRPATHRAHGVRATTIAAAGLIPVAVAHALEACAALGLGDAKARSVARELCQAAGAGGMVGGQALDLAGEDQTLDADALDLLHRLKTGALLAASLRMGALAAGAGGQLVAALDVYGRSVGLAFQITDDVLDATATARALGKNPSDALLGKSTYVALYGLEEARRRARTQVQRAQDALARVGLTEPALSALSRYVVERER